MAIKTINDEILYDIADAIRERGRTSDTYYPHSMAQAISDISPLLQDKTVKSTTAQQTVTCDEGYEGLGTITVEALDLEEKTVKSTTSPQTVTPTSGKDGISKITVSPIILENKTVHSGATQTTVTAGNGYDGIGTVTVEALKLENKRVHSGATQTTVTASNGYDGIGTVTVEALNLETKTVKSTTSPQTITTTAGKDGISQITVEPIVLQNKTVILGSSQQLVQADNGYDGLDTVTVPAVNLQNKTVTITDQQQIITADDGYDGLGEVTVPAVVFQATKSATPKDVSVSVTPDTGYDAMEEVVVAPDQLAAMASKSYADVGVVRLAQLIDLENGFSQNAFYGWGQYFRSTVEDTSIAAGDGGFGGPKYCKVKLPKNITSIEDRAFCGMSGLIEVIADLDNPVTIGSRAFAYTHNLTTVGNLWSKITAIGSSAFRVINSGDGFDSAFEHDKDIECPLLTGWIGSGSNALSRCSFKSFTAPLLTSVSPYAFVSDYHLQTVDFTEVTSIAQGAFQNCHSLTDIYLRGDSVVTLENVDAFTDVDVSNLTLHVPSSLVQSYMYDTNWYSLVYIKGLTIVGISE